MFDLRSGLAALLFWAVLPGAAASFTVNGILMRRHGDAGLATYEKVALGVQVVLLGALAALILANESGTFLGLFYGVPLYALLAAIVCGMAVERNWHLHPRADAAPDDAVS